MPTFLVLFAIFQCQHGKKQTKNKQKVQEQKKEKKKKKKGNQKDRKRELVILFGFKKTCHEKRYKTKIFNDVIIVTSIVFSQFQNQISNLEKK